MDKIDASYGDKKVAIVDLTICAFKLGVLIWINLPSSDSGHSDEHKVEGEPNKIAVSILNEVADGLVHIRLLLRLLETVADKDLVVHDVAASADHVEVEAVDLNIEPDHVGVLWVPQHKPLTNIL